MRFLSLVQVALVPLYLAAGPSFYVWTHNESTEQWISEALLNHCDAVAGSADSTQPWWLRSTQQSDSGILLKVEDGVGDIHSTPSSGYNITEILVYAAISKEQECSGILSSPSGSSSGAGDDAGAGDRYGTKREIKIYALPLSSRKHEQFDRIQGLDLQPLHNGTDDGKASFLPAAREDIPTRASSPWERSRLSNLFDEARDQRKRLTRHGGGGVSKVMARMDGPGLHLRSASGETSSTIPVELLTDISLKGASGKSLSRASSISSFRSVEPTRPPSRRESLINGKRSSLHRVESITPADEVSDGNMIEQKNKAALSRIVMTGMRIYGLQQKKGMEASRPLYDDDEYKLIYHQTFKGALFAFRTHVNLESINQDAMRDTVDRLLAIFCNDPLATQASSGVFLGESSKDE